MKPNERRCTINDVEYVSDAMIIGHLRAAATNFEIAAKLFKLHHFDWKDLEVAQTFDIVRRFAKRAENEFCDLVDKKIQCAREAIVKREIERMRSLP